MKRRFEGLHQSDLAGDELPDGLFLVRVNRAQYRWHAQKPYYSVRFSVLEPKQYMGRQFTGRVYCTTKGLWKLTWFLRDFSYHNELMGRDEIDDNALVGLRGVVRSRIAWLKALPYTISTLLLRGPVERILGGNGQPD